MSIYVAVHFLKDQIYTHPNLSAALSLFSLVIWLFVRRPSNIPPNPWWIFPLLGHRPLLRGDPILTLRRLRKDLGEVFSVYIDAQLVIVVNGFSAIKEAFDVRGQEFHWRPNTRVCDLFHFGALCNSGSEWRDQRRVTESGISHVTSHVLPLTMREAGHLIDALKNENGQPFDAKSLLYSAVFNSLGCVIYSRRMDYADERIKKAVDRFNENLELFSDTKFPNFFPFQKFLMGDFFDVKYLRINMSEIHQKIINPVFLEHQDEFKEDKICDFVDIYLNEMKKSKGVEGTTIEEKSCQAQIYDILWHGTTTLGATLVWAVLFLLHNQDEKKKVTQSLDKYFSSNESKKVEEKPPQLPAYFQAFVLEVQRLANVSQISMARAVAKEKFLKGYRVPGDAVILPNLDSIFMDSDIWGDPENFRPDRFISAEGGRLSIPTEFIPFFIGVRKCPGAGMAHTILSSLLASIVFNFDLQPEAEGKLPSCKRQRGLIPLPPAFKCKFISRRQ